MTTKTLNNKYSRNRGSLNGMWKGDKVGYSGLHDWVRRRFPKTEVCQNCKKEPPRDLANISQKYLRDLTDWEWLCRRCHMKGDGRMKNIYWRPMSEEGKQRLRERNLKLGIRPPSHKGIPKSEEWKKWMSENMKKRWKMKNSPYFNKPRIRIKK